MQGILLGGKAAWLLLRDQSRVCGEYLGWCARIDGNARNNPAYVGNTVPKAVHV